MKARIHFSHLETGSCLGRARECSYWPEMSAEIMQYISTCEMFRGLDAAFNEPRGSVSSPEKRSALISFPNMAKYILLSSSTTATLKR